MLNPLLTLDLLFGKTDAQISQLAVTLSPQHN